MLGIGKIRKRMAEKIDELECLIKELKAEKLKLCETLNSVNSELNAHDLWLKMWHMAFTEAIRVCWDLTKDNTKNIVETVKNKTATDLRKEMENDIEDRNKELEKSLKNMSVNKMSIINAREEAEKNYLLYNKLKDRIREEYFKGQLDLIERILNGKKN